jgi:hypothetical protein
VGVVGGAATGGFPAGGGLVSFVAGSAVIPLAAVGRSVAVRGGAAGGALTRLA